MPRAADRRIPVRGRRSDDRSSNVHHAVVTSWQRVRSTGLIPGVAMDRPHLREVDTQGKFFRSADSVLRRMRPEIADERLSIMLIDSTAAMLTTVNGCAAIDALTEHLGATPGAVWREDTTGTNALVTPFETRQPIFISGREHYVEALKNYSCYGAPIFNPFNGRLEGVLDIMCDADAESGLMRPYIDSAVAQIQQNLKRERAGDVAAMVRAFEAAAKHHAVVVVGLAQSMVLQSPAAAELLTPSDVQRLRAAVPDADNRLQLTLANGQQATARFDEVDGTDGMLIRLQTRRRSFAPRGAAPVDRGTRVREWRSVIGTERSSAIVIGEPGTGRSAALAQTVRSDGALLVAVKEDTTAAEASVRRELERESPGILAIDDLDLLSQDLIELVERAIVSGRRRVVASSAPAAADDPVRARIIASFPLRLDMPPLRDMRHELFGVITEIAGPGVPYRFTGKAARVLESYSWPGNRNELTAVLGALARKRGTLIDLPDLPAYLRNKSTTKAMTPWQRATRDAIVNALEVMHGNKAHTADFLGISRGTLYHHLREYGIHA